MKPLFIPLNAWAYDQFAAGTKFDELRRYGPRMRILAKLVEMLFCHVGTARETA